MNNIIATISAVDRYKSQLFSAYNGAKQLADSQKKEIGNWDGQVSFFIETVGIKRDIFQDLLSQVASLISQLSIKVSEWMEEAQRIYNAGHWVERHDDEGRVIGREYEYDVIAYNHAISEAERYQQLVNEARSLESEIREILDYVLNVLKTLEQNEFGIINDYNEYSALLMDIERFAATNLEKLTSIISALRDYASCMAFSDMTGSFNYQTTHNGSSAAYNEWKSQTSTVITKTIFTKETIDRGKRETRSNPTTSLARENGPAKTPSSGSGMPSSAGAGTSSSSGSGMPSSAGASSSPSSGSGMGGSSSSGGSIPSSDSRNNFNDSDYSKIEENTRTRSHYARRSKEDKKIVGDVSALVDYSGEDWKKINRIAAGKADSLRNSETDYGIKKYTADAEEISSAIAKTKLSNSIRIYRGQSIRPIMESIGCNDYEDLLPDELQKRVCGATYLHKSFMSTSADINVAEEFANHRNGVILDIELPKGAQALYMGEISQRGIHFDKPESEILLQKGTEYMIQSIERLGPRGEQYYMKVRVLSQEKR